jgi:hypothetical protein
MEGISTVRDFAKSRFTVCFLLAMIGLYGLCANSFPEVEVSELWRVVFLGDASLTKTLCLIWLMMFLSGVLAGNEHVSHVAGGAAITASIIMFIFFKGTVFTMSNNLFSALLLYFGLYVLENSTYFESEYDFSPGKIVFHFIVSRMFIGFLQIYFAFSTQIASFTSFKDFLQLSDTFEDFFGAFFILNLLVLLGSVFLFVKRNIIGVLHAIPSLLIFAMIVIQLPVIVLFFKDQKDYISLYYSEVASQWVFIIMAIAYGVLGYATLKTCKLGALILKKIAPKAKSKDD